MPSHSRQNYDAVLVSPADCITTRLVEAVVSCGVADSRDSHESVELDRGEVGDVAEAERPVELVLAGLLVGEEDLLTDVFEAVQARSDENRADP